MAVVQTVVISRALGITEYGVYGLLFGDHRVRGFNHRVADGTDGTVFVSRYRESEKKKAAAVISIVSKFSWGVAAVFLLLLTPFSQHVSVALLGSGGYQAATLLGIIFIGATIVSGVQDGIAQGFEIFEFLAKLKILSSVLVLASIYPAARYFGLTGVLCAILGGLVFKFLILQMTVMSRRKDAGIPAVGSGVSFRSLVGNFALPSMVVSLLVGLVTWAGMFILSKQQLGFDGVAIANTGLQWRGPVLLLAASLAVLPVPAFSRLFASNDMGGAKKLRHTLLLLNIAAADSGGFRANCRIRADHGALRRRVCPRSHGILADRTVDYSNGRNQRLHQELVGSARMWRQLWLHVPFAIIMGGCFIFLVPRYGGIGYGWSLLAGSIFFLATVLATQLIAPPRKTMIPS